MGSNVFVYVVYGKKPIAFKTFDFASRNSVDWFLLSVSEDIVLGVVSHLLGYDGKVNIVVTV